MFLSAVPQYPYGNFSKKIRKCQSERVLQIRHALALPLGPLQPSLTLLDPESLNRYDNQHEL